MRNYSTDGLPKKKKIHLNRTNESQLLPETILRSIWARHEITVSQRCCRFLRPKRRTTECNNYFLTSPWHCPTFTCEDPVSGVLYGYSLLWSAIYLPPFSIPRVLHPEVRSGSCNPRNTIYLRSFSQFPAFSYMI